MTAHTEAEAKGRWCPFARLGVHAGAAAVAVNRHPDPAIQIDCCCVGAACMAWRWADSEPAFHPETRRGFCGLAGLPAA